MSGSTVVLAVTAVSVAAMVGGYFVFGNTDDPPYSVQDTLPHMVSDFGANARVADIRVNGADDVVYEIIAPTGLVHVRDYRLGEIDLQHSGITHVRKVVNSVRDATAADLRNAQVRLGEVPPGVVAKLFAQLRYPLSDGYATLEGTTWTLQSDTKLFDQYEARYDGTGLHQTRSRATVFLPKPLGQTQTSTSASQQPKGALPPPSPAPGLLKAERLLACVRRAHSDIVKLVACQRLYGP